MVLAIANGGLRVGILVPRFGEPIGHAVSSLILCGLIAMVAWIALPWIGPATLRVAAGVGALWLALTQLFEFGTGHFLMGQPWSRLLADYNVLNGRIWVLVLLTTALAPIAAARLRGPDGSA
jgi:hypothetical protein